MKERDGFICGAQACLRPIAYEDTPLIVRWRNDSHVKSFLLGQEELTPEGHLKWMESRVSTGECIQFIIQDREGKACGTVFLKNIDKESKEAEFGIFIGEPSCRGKGYGKEATALIMRHAFSKLAFAALWLKVLETNVSAVHIYETLGFKEVEKLAEMVERNGKRVKLLHMRAENAAPGLKTLFVED